VEEIRTWFELPDVVLLVAERADGRIVGYGDLTDQAGHERFPFDIRVPPAGDQASEILEALLDALEEQAAALAAPGATTRLFIPQTYELLRRLGEARGYEPFRYSFQMRIEFDGEVTAPPPPDGISVRTFVVGQDERAVYDTHQSSFQDHFEYAEWPYESWRKWAFSESFDPSVWWLAEEGTEMVGVCLGRLEGFAGPEIGWINVLGVRPPWRRRGIARALLLTAFADFQGRGKRGAALGVDGLNTTGAVRLYEQAGMHVERRFDQYKKPLPT
jgi:mycothiol synthase